MKNKNLKYLIILSPIAIVLLILFVTTSFWFGLPLSIVLIIGHLLYILGHQGSEYLEKEEVNKTDQP